MKGRKFIHRWVVDYEAIVIGVGTAPESIQTFTAARPLLVVGWDIVCRIMFSGATVVGSRGIGSGYISRDRTGKTPWDLQTTRAEVHAFQNIAGTDTAGVLHTEPPPLRMWFTVKEAEDLGLLLGYGDSIYVVLGAEVKSSGTTSFIAKGVIYYYEV